MNFNEIFNEFINKAWNDHATQAPKVAERIKNNLNLIDNNEQIPQMALLATHVFGEHLGQWENGILTLQKIRELSVFQSGSESELAINRSIRSLQLASGAHTSIDDLSASDQIRVLTVAACALSEQKKAERAQNLFRQALQIAERGLAKDDPANRALAVAGNNLACALEEREKRNTSETELMILASTTGLKYWEIAGTWLQVERAEYRLCQTYLKVGENSRALMHAKNCLDIVEENSAPALEFFFAFEAMALASRANGHQDNYLWALDQMRSMYSKLSDSDKAWCEATLKKVI